MDTNKMREQFESAWRARYPEHSEIALKRSGLDPEDYSNTRVKDAWWAWKASREAVVVELPSPMDAPPYASYEGGWNDMRDEAVDGIEEQGLKVKAREVKP